MLIKKICIEKVIRKTRPHIYEKNTNKKNLFLNL